MSLPPEQYRRMEKYVSEGEEWRLALDGVEIRATHPYGYRAGEWARLTAVAAVGDRWCYAVAFLDGKTDLWPVVDPREPYEFRYRPSRFRRLLRWLGKSR